MTRGIINILSLVYLTLVVTSTFSINEVPIKSDIEGREKLKKIIRSTLRRSGKLIGGLILIGIVIEILSTIV